MDREDKLGIYLRYLGLCNQHLFDGLGEFVARDVGGSTKGLANYIRGCSDVVAAFPDYRWILQHTVVEDDWLAARLIGVGIHSGPFRGVPPTGKVIRTQEMVMYRFAENKIAECWGDLHTTVRDELVSGS
ncbi:MULTISPECIES: ester cyclase [unclassified Rhizobium]|uniref:ester cyclase n=1 Tax=unclassified Rhizobium TaxID=2613769 RepID=UPI001FFE1198|nr:MULTISPECIES: ester cyclase [unclassified Rhizobium]